MTYMKNGGMIRIVPDEALPRFLKRGFVPLETGAAPPKKSTRRPPEKLREGKPHGA